LFFSVWYGNNSNIRQFSIILVADRWRIGLGLPKKRASILLFSSGDVSGLSDKFYELQLKKIRNADIGIHYGD